MSALPLALFAVAPSALGGLRLRARAGDVRDQWLTALRASLPPETPWCRVPAHVDDEALSGGMDLSATLVAGRVVRTEGVLARARGGVLVVAMAERIRPALAAKLSRWSEAAGVALLLLDEGVDADEQPPSTLLDRIGLHVTLSPREPVPIPDVRRLARARDGWRQVVVEDALVEALMEAGAALGVESADLAYRALIATRIAAALAGHSKADAEAAAKAVQTVLAPRATRHPSEEGAEPMQSPPTDAHPGERPEPGGQQPAETGPPDDPGSVEPLAEQLIAAAKSALPADLLDPLGTGMRLRRAGEGGRTGTTMRTRDRGRPVGVQRGIPRDGARLALIETLRAAAPWQRLRRAGRAADAARIVVRRDDLRVQLREQRRGTTTIFAIDASGSQAMHRLSEAKGAVELLLADCYARRDRVAVLAFRGGQASLLLAPTRSLVRARRELSGLPGGGGTPLALGIDAARALAESVAHGGSTPLIVFLTDGRANVSRRGEPGRATALAEAMSAARMLAVGSFRSLLIDTGDHPSVGARALAEAMGARYQPLPYAGAHALSNAVARERRDADSVSGRA